MSRYLDLLSEVRKDHDEYHGLKLNDKVLIVDALNSYIRCFAAVPTMNEDGEHIGGVTGFLKSIGLAIRTFKPTRCVIIFDGRGGSQRRRKIYSEYKENRRSMTRLNRTYDFNNLTEEQKSMRGQLIALAYALKHLPLTVLAPNNVEADDVIAYVADVISDRGGKSIVMSTDKDFLQIVSDSVELWNPVKKKTYFPQTVVEEYGIHPHNFAIFRSIDGDKSDNIPGVKGVGPKGLIKNFPQIQEADPVSIDDILDQANSQQKGKIFEKIRANEDIIRRNYLLMRLDEVQMSASTKLDVISRLDSPSFDMDKVGLTTMLVDNKMLGAFSNYDQWLLTTFTPLTRFILSD